MNKKFSWSGTIVVLLSLACMLYYYLIYRHTLESQINQKHFVVDNSSNI